MTQYRRIDDDAPKRIDEPHVPPGDASHWLNVDGPIQPIGRGALQEGKDRERVDGGVLDLCDALPRGHEEHAERPLAGAGNYQRGLAIGGREPVKEARLGGSGRLTVPAEESAEPRAKSEEKTYGGIGGTEALCREEGPELEDTPTGLASGEIDHPHIVQGDAREQGMGSEADLLVLLRSYTHRVDFLGRCLTDMRFSCAQQR
jgi:hypothetical protein